MDNDKICIAYFRKISGVIYPQDYATGDGSISNLWGNACIEKAYVSCPTGGTIYLRAGYYKLAGQLTVSKKVNVIGEGINKVFIITTTSSGIYLDVNSAYSTLKNITIDGDAQSLSDTGSSCIVVKYANHLLMENIKVKNAGTSGMSLIGSYNTYNNIWAVDCYSHGIHPGGSTASANSYNLYKNIYITGTKTSNAFDDNGNDDSSYNTYSYIVCWENAAKGIAIHGQVGGELTNSKSYDNTSSYGIDISHSVDFLITDCLAYGNKGCGIYLNDNENTNLSNTISKNNTGSGIYIEDCPYTKLSLCQSYDDRDTPTQEYGIRLYGTVGSIDIINCKLSPNKIGEIYNPNGVEIVIINN